MKHWERKNGRYLLHICNEPNPLLISFLWKKILQQKWSFFGAFSEPKNWSVGDRLVVKTNLGKGQPTEHCIYTNRKPRLWTKPIKLVIGFNTKYIQPIKCPIHPSSTLHTWKKENTIVLIQKENQVFGHIKPIAINCSYHRTPQNQSKIQSIQTENPKLLEKKRINQLY